MTLKQQIAEKIAEIISPFAWEEIHPEAQEVYLDHADALTNIIIKEIEGKKEIPNALDTQDDRFHKDSFNQALDTIITMLKEGK